MKSISLVLVSAIALLAGCGTSSESQDTGGGSGGAPGSGGQTAGSGGSGSGGAVPGTGGAVGSGGSDVDAGTMDAPPEVSMEVAPETGGNMKQFSCPAGPLPAGTVGPQMAVCPGFKFNFGYHEGPTWIASQNAFFFSDFTEGNGRTGDIIKFTPATNTCEVFIKDAGCNGLAVGANGKIIGACHTSHSITEFDPVTKAKRLIADNFNGRNFASPNDVVVHSNGTIYFTNPTYESISTNPYPQATFWIDPAGKVNLLANGASNGIALSPDERKLMVVQAGTWSLDANGVPMTRTGGGPGGDGISVDCAGGIHSIGTNSAYGGPDGKLIFIAARNGVFTAVSNIPGLP
jgi:gluconolactonase